MSGSLYGYTPWSAPRETPGQAFAAGLRESREDERRLMAMDEARQQARLRELQEGRSAAAEGRTSQMFPVSLETAQQALQAARQTYGFTEQSNPLRLQQLRLQNQRTQQGISEAATAQQALGGMALPPLLPVAGGNRPPTPGVSTPGGSLPGIIMPGETSTPAAPAAPAAPAPTPGPQSSLEERPAWLNPEFGQRRFTGVGPMLASGGVSDYTGGFPTGYAGQEFVSVSAQAPQAAPTAPGAQPTQGAVVARPLTAMTPREVMAYLNPIPGFTPPPGFTPADARLELARRGIEAGYVVPFQREAEAAAFGGSLPMPAAAYNPNLLPAEDAAQAMGGPPAPTAPTPATAAPSAPTAPRAASVQTTGMTEAQMAAVTADRSDQVDVGAAPTQIAADRVDARQQQQPSDPYIIEPLQVARDQRRVQQDYALLQQQYRVAVARRDTALAMQLQQRAVELGRRMEYLNGMDAITRFNQGDIAPLAAAMYEESGRRFQMQPNQDGTFNLFLDGQLSRSNVSRNDVLNSARSLYDTNFQEAVRQRRERDNSLALRRAQQRIDQMERVSADIVLKELEAQLKAANPDREVRTITLPDGGQAALVFEGANIVNGARVVTLPAISGGQPRVVIQPMFVNR